MHNLFVEMHPGRMSILDFHSARADFYFLLRKGQSVRRLWTGPALLAPFLPKFGALMLHAAAVSRQGRTAVFLAPDEGGKTTASLLAPSGTILGDDQVIVRRRRGRFRVWGTPWGRHTDAHACSQLSGLFVLKKAKSFALDPLPRRALIPLVWEESKISLAILPKPLKEKAFAVLCDIARSAPCWTLSFPKNHINWNEIDAALRRKA